MIIDPIYIPALSFLVLCFLTLIANGFKADVPENRLALVFMVLAVINLYYDVIFYFVKLVEWLLSSVV